MASKARERLIASAIDLMRRRGVAGTGVTDLIARSGAARRSIYLHFPGGKDELIAEATGVSGRFIGRGIATHAAEDPAVTLASFVAMWKSTLIDSDFEAGCPVAAGALAGGHAPSAPAAAAEAFAAWERQFASQLTAWGIAPERAESVAVMAVCAIEGAVILCISGRTLQPLDVVFNHLVELIESPMKRKSA